MRSSSWRRTGRSLPILADRRSMPSTTTRRIHTSAPQSAFAQVCCCPRPFFCASASSGAPKSDSTVLWATGSTIPPVFISHTLATSAEEPLQRRWTAADAHCCSGVDLDPPIYGASVARPLSRLPSEVRDWLEAFLVSLVKWDKDRSPWTFVTSGWPREHNSARWQMVVDIIYR